MRRSLVPWFLCLVLVAASRSAVADPAAPASAAASFEAPRRYVLPNGLEVILQRDRAHASVAVVVAYRVGKRDDPPGLAGLAHLVEHMTFRGSRHLPPLRALSRIEAWGGSGEPAYTTLSHTVYQTLVPATQLHRVLWLESERMAFTLEAMTAEHTALENAVVRREMAARSAGADEVRRMIGRTVFPKDHPYALEAVNTTPENLPLGPVQWLFQQRYRPDNATLVIVGDFDPVATEAAVARYFAPIANPPFALVRQEARAVIFGGSTRLDLIAKVNEGRLQLLWALPAAEQAQEAELQVVAGALEGRLTERLIRIDRNARRVEFRTSRVEATLFFGIEVRLRPDEDGAAIEQVVRAAIEDLAARPLSSEELRGLTRGAVWSVLDRTESFLQRAQAFALARSPAHPEGLYDPAGLVARLESLTADQVMQFVGRTLALDHCLVAHVTYVGYGRAGPVIERQQGELAPAVEAR